MLLPIGDMTQEIMYAENVYAVAPNVAGPRRKPQPRASR
jgi:hypothetical protein